MITIQTAHGAEFWHTSIFQFKFLGAYIFVDFEMRKLFNKRPCPLQLYFKINRTKSMPQWYFKDASSLYRMHYTSSGLDKNGGFMTSWDLRLLFRPKPQDIELYILNKSTRYRDVNCSYTENSYYSLEDGLILKRKYKNSAQLG